MEPQQQSQQPQGITVDSWPSSTFSSPLPTCEGGPMTVNPFNWLFDFGASLKRIEASLVSLHKKVDDMATYAEVKQEWVEYTQQLQAENAQLRQAATDAQTAAQANADALAQFQADDAATDAQQLADQAQAIADDLQSTLDGLQTPPVEPEPLPDPDPGTDTPPTDSGEPVDPGWTGGVAPSGEEGGAPQVNPL